MLRNLFIVAATVLSAGLLAAPIHAQTGTAYITNDDQSQHHPVLGRNGMVVSQETYASMAGRDILKAGGNAVDAAVATGFALAVTHPQAGNIGGGGFMMIYLAEEKRNIAIDYREMAPAAAYRDMFLGEDGNVDNRKARFSMSSAGVPGTVMGLTQALAKYGTMSLAQVMAPAISLAEDGFPMTWQLYESLGLYEARLKGDPASAKIFYKADGSRFEPGEVFRQPKLAATLKRIAQEGAKGFYDGPVADALVSAVQEGGGLISKEDLANYVAKERAPLTGHFMGYDIAVMPPPSSGGVHVLEMLNILSGYDLKELGHNSAAYLHRLTETMKYAYADRSEYLGDPDFFNVPVAALTSAAHADTIRGKIDLERATPSTDIAPTPVDHKESEDTTHFSVMDRWGNMVANTYTINFTYGNGKAVPEAGFLMNNEMDDFSSKPGAPNGYGLLGGEANAIEAGKRPLSSMTPILLFKDGEPFMATGSPGGSTIITVVLQTVLNAMVFDMNPAAATAAPRMHHQWHPDKLFLEPGHSIDTRRILQAMGHNVKAEPGAFDRVLGATQTVARGKDGIILGAADPRRPGSLAAGF